MCFWRDIFITGGNESRFKKQWDTERNGRLAPTYFSPNYKYFDQLLRTVKNETSFEFSFQRFFTKINSTTDFYTLCYHDFPLKICCFTVAKKFVEKPLCDSENFWYRKILWIRGLCHVFLTRSTEKLRRGTLLYCV